MQEFIRLRMKKSNLNGFLKIGVKIKCQFDYHLTMYLCVCVLMYVDIGAEQMKESLGSRED